MSATASNPPVGGKERFPTFGLIWRWFGGMSKGRFAWKSKTDSADRLEFWHGGERAVVIVGILLILNYLFIISAYGYTFVRFEEQLIAYGWANGEYRAVASIIIPMAVLFAMKAINLLLGVWLIFGRTRIVLDKATGRITKTYLLRSFRVLHKGCSFSEVTAVEIRKHMPIWRILAPRVICLRRDGEKPVRLCDVLRKCDAQSLVMAQEMAEFLGMPGPQETDLVKVPKSD